MNPNKMIIEGKNYRAVCTCQWYSKMFCSCDYKNKMAQRAKSIEKFCNGAPKRQVMLPNAKPIVQTLDKSENDLYLHRTLGPGAYSYAQPRIDLCESDVIGYNIDRNGLLPLNSKEVNLESSLRYSENIDLKSVDRPLCKDRKLLETQYTREIRPCNDLSATPFDRFEMPLCDPQEYIARREFQQGKDTKNAQSDAFFEKYRKNF